MTTRSKNRRNIPLIVYCSQTDNTRRVAEAMASPLAAECVAVEQLKEHQLRGRPLVGLGSGVYWLRLERRIIELADRLPAGCRVFVFSTSGWRGQVLADFFQAELIKHLQRREVELLGAWHCPGQDRNFLFKWLHISRGRPNEDDIADARAFAASLKTV
jgi:flavodoxin